MRFDREKERLQGNEEKQARAVAISLLSPEEKNLLKERQNLINERMPDTEDEFSTDVTPVHHSNIIYFATLEIADSKEAYNQYLNLRAAATKQKGSIH